MYKKFNEYTDKQQNRLDTRVMNPQITGLKFKNPYKVENNDMRVPPLVSFKNEYPKFQNTYKQLNCNH